MWGLDTWSKQSLKQSQTHFHFGPYKGHKCHLPNFYVSDIKLTNLVQYMTKYILLVGNKNVFLFFF